MTLTYPSGGLLSDNDYVTFQHFEYSSNRSGGGNPPAQGQMIQLYMPTNTPNVANENDWGHIAMDGPWGAFKQDLAHISGSKDMNSGIDQIKTILGDKSRRPELKSIAYQGGVYTASKTLGFESPNHVTQLGQGKIFNPNIELMYQSPKPRSFTMNFTFIPRNPLEASLVNNIILEFKKWSSPSGNRNGAMFQVPRLWQVTYVSGGRMDVMNRFKPAALTNVSVVANPNANMHATYTDGMPIETSMAVSFLETDIILREDHEEIGGQGY